MACLIFRRGDRREKRACFYISCGSSLPVTGYGTMNLGEFSPKMDSSVFFPKHLSLRGNYSSSDGGSPASLSRCSSNVSWVQSSILWLPQGSRSSLQTTSLALPPASDTLKVFSLLYSDPFYLKYLGEHLIVILSPHMGSGEIIGNLEVESVTRERERTQG